MASDRASSGLVFTPVATCAHGFPDDQCLICHTLGAGTTKAKPSKKAKPAKLAKSAPSTDMLLEAPAAPLPATRASANQQLRRASGAKNLFWALLAVALVGGVAWLFFGSVFHLVLHIAELVAVALVAGWAGYEVGRARGRKGH